MTSEEEDVYNKILNLKREKEYLYVIYEELDELARSGYSSLSDEQCRGLMFALQEYKKWNQQ